MARYNTNGSLDSTFGNSGEVITAAGGGKQAGVAIQSNGQIIVVSATTLQRYNTNGTLDTTFGNGGIVQLEGTATAVAIQPDGRILTANPLARYLASAGSLTLSGFPTTTIAGVAQTITVTALNANGTVNTGYTGTVTFNSSDSQAGLPSNFTFPAADDGVATFTVTLDTAGSQSIMATDGTISGTESGITVTPAVASTLVVSGFPTLTNADLPGNVTITALIPTATLPPATPIPST